MTAPTVTPIADRGYAHPAVLVDCAWVAAHLDDPKVRLLESDEDLLLYEIGHIPGAMKIDGIVGFMDTEAELPTTRFPVPSMWRPLPPLELHELPAMRPPMFVDAQMPMTPLPVQTHLLMSGLTASVR